MSEFFLRQYFKHIILKVGILLSYIKEVKSMHKIVLPTTCLYQHCGGAMFDQSYFVVPVLHNILHIIFACKFYHFTCSHILEGDKVRIKNMTMINISV